MLANREQGQYWRILVCAAITEGQYFPVQLKQGRLVSCLLYGTVLVASFEFAGFAPKPKYMGWTVSMSCSFCCYQAKSHLSLQSIVSTIFRYNEILWENKRNIIVVAITVLFLICFVFFSHLEEILLFTVIN